MVGCSEIGVWEWGEDSDFAGAGAATGRVDAGFEGAGAFEDDWRCDPACEPAKKLRISPLRGILKIESEILQGLTFALGYKLSQEGTRLEHCEYIQVRNLHASREARERICGQ